LFTAILCANAARGLNTPQGALGCNEFERVCYLFVWAKAGTSRVRRALSVSRNARREWCARWFSPPA